MTTLKDLLNDFAEEILVREFELRFGDRDTESDMKGTEEKNDILQEEHDEMKHDLIEEYLEIITARLIGK